MVKLAKAAKKGAKEAPPKKKAPPPPKEVEESSEEDSEDEEEEQAPPPKAAGKKNATPAKAVKNGKSVAKQESEDDDEEDDDSEEEPPAPKKAAKATPAKAAKATPAKAKAAPAKKEESDDDEDDDDEESEEEEAPPPKKATPAKAAAKATPAKAAKEESDDEEDDDEDDDDESEEEAPPKKATPAKPAAKVTPAKPAGKATPAKKEESEEDDDDDEDEEDDSEEEMDTTPAPAKKKTVKAKQQEEEEDDDDDDDDDEDDDEEEEAPVTPGKRKADQKEKGTPPAKKPKSDGEAFTLYMGNLNSEKDFDELKEAAAKFFKKESLIVQEVRLGGTRKYGYADFSSEEDLQKALTLNGKKFLGQPVKLDRARSKDTMESKKDKDSRTLFVKNLPYSATQEELKEIFEDALAIRMPVNHHDGTSRGIAYIEFKTEEAAEKMLQQTQGMDVQGRSIMVDFTGSKSSRAPVPAPSSKTLVVNNLAFSATEESLQNVFEKAVSIRIPQNNGRPKGYAFVEFENMDDSKEAIESLNNTDIEGRVIRLEYSQGAARGGGPTKTLFVKGLSDETTEQTLKDAFEGSIAARIATDKDTGSCKGYGFVDFDSEEDCKAAKEAMDDGEIDGNKVTLDFAKPKGEGGRGGGRGGFGGGFGGGRGGRGGFGGRGRGRGGGFGGGFGGRGGGGRGGFGGRGGGRGGFRGGRGGGGDRPQGKKIKFND